MLADLLRDVRLAIRSLTKAPGFALAAILTLALGVGATSAIFSVVNGVVLRPMPYPDSESLVMVWEITPQSGQFSVAPANFFDWRQQATTFEGLAALGNSDVTLQGPNGPEQVPAAFVSANFFKVMGVRPALGRGFTPEEETPGRDGVIVISHGAWQRRFGGDPRVLGTHRLDERTASRPSSASCRQDSRFPRPPNSGSRSRWIRRRRRAAGTTSA